MKIIAVDIHNFRSIQNSHVSGPTNDVWTFIGQNNAGKSSVFHAIRAFYGDYSVTIEDFCRSSADQPIEILIEYILEDEEFNQLPDYYKLPNNKLKVVSRFTKDNLKGKWHGFIIKNNKAVENEEEFFGQKNVLIGKLGEVIYVPAVKELSEELKKNKSSIFTKLVSRILSETLTSLDSWNGLVAKAQEFAKDIRSPVKDSKEGELKSVHEIEEKLGSMLSSWQLKPEIIVSPPTPEDIILSGAQLKLIGTETNQEEDPLVMGSGAQRSVVNSLLLLWSQVQSIKVKSDKKKFNGNLTLLLYEEPEALLHYDQIRSLSRYLEDIAKSSNNQVFACTHSPDFISTKKNTLSSISRFTRNNGKTTVYKPDVLFLQELQDDKDDFDFALWLNPDRNTMFFVDKVILVEGTSDKTLLNYLIQEKTLNTNTYVIDCGCKSNIPKFMTLCDKFGIYHSVMFDLDSNKGLHKTWNQNIENNRSEFTKDLLSFADNLESHIGFNTPKDSYRKPIEMLKQARDGKLKTNFEKEFIDFITK